MSDDLRDTAREKVDDVAGAGTADKIEGSIRDLLGRGKEALGGVIGNDSLQAEGETEQVEGKAQGFLGEIKEGVEGLGDKIKGVFHSHDKPSED